MQDVRLEGGTLRYQFPQVYVIAWYNNALIQDSFIGNMENSECFVEVIRNLNEWEVGEYKALLLTLPEARPDDTED